MLHLLTNGRRVIVHLLSGSLPTSSRRPQDRSVWQISDVSASILDDPPHDNVNCTSPTLTIEELGEGLLEGPEDSDFRLARQE